MHIERMPIRRVLSAPAVRISANAALAAVFSGALVLTEGYECIKVNPCFFDPGVKREGGYAQQHDYPGT